jgi:hypothetical protein
VAALVVALVVVCAACRLDVTAHVQVNDDGSGSVTVVVAADAELLAKAPGALADLRLDDVRTAGWTVTGPRQNAAGGQELTLQKGFRTPAEGDAVLAELNGSGGPLHDVHLSLTRTFATHTGTVAGRVQLDGGTAALGDEGLAALLGGKQPFADRLDRPLGEALHLTVIAELPGAVSATDGNVSDDRRSVTFEPALGDGASTPLTATWIAKDQAALDARRTQRVARVALVAYVLLLAAAVAGGALWWRRRQV